MECNDARRLIEFARPGVAELEAADLGALEQHLAACPECGSAYRAERRRDERIAQAMQAVSVPEAARVRLTARLVAARFAWWRNRVLAAATVTVGAVLAAMASYTFLARPAFDPIAVALATYEQAGQWRSPEEARMVADQWLRGIDRRLAAPGEWNYKLLAFVGRSDFAGLSSVPTLVFTTRGDATARIYVVRSSAFKNLDAFDQPVEDGGCTVAVRRYAELPGWAFIVVTGGGPIELFLRPVLPRDPA